MKGLQHLQVGDKKADKEEKGEDAVKASKKAIHAI